MRRGKPSTTSNLTAFARSLATLGVTDLRDFRDPQAAQLLAQPFAAAHAGVKTLLERRPGLRRIVGIPMRSGLDLIAMRAAAIDEHWRAAAADGVRQFVVLGAGLDTRSWRLPPPEGSTVFEADHPDTQAWKRARAERLPGRTPVWVGVDFNRDDLAGALLSAGLRPGERIFYVFEGVIPYLREERTASLLAALARITPPGSTLAASYVLPRGDEGGVPLLEIVGAAFRLLGEPFVGLLDSQRMAALLRSAGFAVVEDTGPVEWAQRHCTQQPALRHDLRERLVVARRG